MGWRQIIFMATHCQMTPTTTIFHILTVCKQIILELVLLHSSFGARTQSQPRYWIKYRKIRLSPSLCIQSYCHLHNNALADECRILGVYQIKGILKVCVDTWPPKGDKSHWNIDKLLLRCWWLFFFSAWQRRRYGVCHLLRHGRLMMMGVGSERGAETMSVCLPGEATRKWEFARAENYISPSRHRYVNRTTNFPFANLNSHTFGIYPSDGRMPQLMSSYLR